MAKNALPSIDDIDDDVLNDALLRGAQSMPSLSVKKPVEMPSPVTALSPQAAHASMPQQPAQPKEDAVVSEDPSCQRVTKAISLPRYVWDWIKEQHREHDEPQNVALMRAMKSGGAPVREEDLVDARKARWQNK